MAVFRVHKQNNFTTINNYLIKDKNLTLKDKGMMLVLLSLPDNWEYSVAGLEKICMEARNTINGILNRLEEHGYLERSKIYENGKIKEWRYDIYEIPKHLYRNFEDIENEDIENEDIENDTQLNTNKLNTKELNTKNICSRVINRLNELNNTKYSTTSNANLKFIKGRLNDGYTEEDLMLVVEKMSYLWHQPSEKDMTPYLRPSTLFRPTNFENYLNMPVKVKKTTKNVKLDLNILNKKGD